MTKKSRDRRKAARYRNNKERSSSEWIDKLVEAHKEKVEAECKHTFEFIGGGKLWIYSKCTRCGQLKARKVE